MEDLVDFDPFWKDKRIFITGHTGFKGAWLFRTLESFGASVNGFSLAPIVQPNLYDLINISSETSTYGDIRDKAKIRSAIIDSNPDIIFHLAAQALVRQSYQDPLETFETNILGTAYTINAALDLKKPVTFVCVTTDKCYQNNEHGLPFKEFDALGGNDVYSASKACAEIVAHSLRESFCTKEVSKRGNLSLVTARCGNVIGGGDWSKDRIIPDIVRSYSSGKPIQLRMPNAVRPWLHVLDSINGYLTLAKKIYQDEIQERGAWNFAPTDTHVNSVIDVVKQFSSLWDKNPGWETDKTPTPNESHTLTLDSSKARNELGWAQKLSFKESIAWTAEWYINYYSDNNPTSLCDKQIFSFYN